MVELVDVEAEWKKSIVAVPDHADNLNPRGVHRIYEMVERKVILLLSFEDPWLEKVPLKPAPDEPYLVFSQVLCKVSREHPYEFFLLSHGRLGERDS